MPRYLDPASFPQPSSPYSQGAPIGPTSERSMISGQIGPRPDNRQVRERKLGRHAPASTRLEVAGLASPARLVEIESEAGRDAL